MKFTAEHYLEAAREKINDARILYNNKRFASAIYFSGVAVECLLRAYRTRIKKEFYERHDLPSLLKASAIAEFVLEKNQREFFSAFGELWVRWKNDYRYASENRLKSDFINKDLHKGLKGQIVKYNSKVALEGAEKVVSLGVLRWH